jgi:ribosomal protein S6E (S10)
MPYKINISSKDGKSWKIQTESDAFIGKSVGQTIHGKDLEQNLEGYEFTISGATDNAGFAHSSTIEGNQLRKVLLTKGWGMKQPEKGLRRRKTYRGKELSEKTSQINLKLNKEGHKKLAEIFPDQNKSPEPKAETPKVEVAAQ